MQFPNSGSGRPFVRIDGRSGSFALSVPEGGDPEIAEMKNKVLDLDLAGADQGWLRLTTDGADWVALDDIDAWLATPRPSPDHNPGVRIDLMCDAWPEPKVRELRGSSRAVTGFIARVAAAAGDIPEGKAVRIRLTGARIVKIGKGTSADIGFEVAPRDKWPGLAVFDEHRDGPDPAPEAAQAVTAKKSAGAFDALEDAAWS
jgi:hypothetical protein